MQQVAAFAAKATRRKRTCVPQRLLLRSKHRYALSSPIRTKPQPVSQHISSHLAAVCDGWGFNDAQELAYGTPSPGVASVLPCKRTAALQGTMRPQRLKDLCSRPVIARTNATSETAPGRPPPALRRLACRVNASAALKGAMRPQRLQYLCYVDR